MNIRKMRIQNSLKVPFLLLLGASMLVGCWYRAPRSLRYPQLVYPMDYPACAPREGTDIVVVPLKIRIRSAVIPHPLHFMRETMRGMDVCSIYDDLTDAALPHVVMDDLYVGGIGWTRQGMQALDTVEVLRMPSVTYRALLTIPDHGDFTEDGERWWGGLKRHPVNNQPHTYVDKIIEDEIVVFNGLEWRHRVVATYSTPAPFDLSKGEVREWNETYDHYINDGRVLRREAKYRTMVLKNPEWLSARRRMTRRLAESVRIEPMSQDEVDAIISEYLRRIGREYSMETSELSQDEINSVVTEYVQLFERRRRWHLEYITQKQIDTAASEYLQHQRRERRSSTQ